MLRLLPLLALVLAPSARAESPIAQVICAPSDRMVQRLTRQYGTERRASGMRSPDELVEIWTDAQGDWTMVIRYASGQSCIVAMGAHWQDKAGVNPT